VQNVTWYVQYWIWKGPYCHKHANDHYRDRVQIQSEIHKIRHDMLIRTSVRKPSRSGNITNNKMGTRLLSTAAKLKALRGGVAKGEATLTLNALLKGPVRRPLRRTIVPYILLPIALLPVGGSKALRTMNVIPVVVVVAVAIRTLVVMRMTSVTIEVGAILILGKVGRKQQR